MIALAVFASGGGSNFQAILNKIAEKQLDARVVLLVSNNSAAGAVQKARSAGIETLHLAPSAFASEEEYARVLLGHLERVKAELVVLAGYMKKLPARLVDVYRNRILNIHPALLPAFGGKGMYGHFVHEAVLAYGAKVTGVTVHLVDEQYDHGAVVMQKTLEVKENDTPETLAARVLVVEHDTYWRAINLFAHNRVTVEKGRARIR